MKLETNNLSLLIGEKQGYDWYEWCVFIDANRDLIDKIEYVEYVLHPTFPNPLRKTDDRLELNSILGRDMSWENWYFSFFILAW